MPPERNAAMFMVHIEPLFIQLVLSGGASNMASIQLKLVWPVLCPMPPWEYAAFQCRGQTQAEIPGQMRMIQQRRTYLHNNSCKVTRQSQETELVLEMMLQEMTVVTVAAC
jgi:hypothetical protein